MNNTTGTPASEKIWPSVLNSELRGRSAHGSRRADKVGVPRRARARTALRLPRPSRAVPAARSMPARWRSSCAMRLPGQPERLRPRAGRYLEHVVLMLAIMRHHVEHVDSIDRHLAQIDRAVGQLELQGPLHQPLGQVAGAHAVGRKLFAVRTSQMSQASRPSRLRSRKIGAASINAAVAEWLSSAPAAEIAGPAAACASHRRCLPCKPCRMVGHDHGPAAVPSGDLRQQVPLAMPAFAIAQPAVHPGEIEIGFPAEGRLRRPPPGCHAVRGHRTAEHRTGNRPAAPGCATMPRPPHLQRSRIPAPVGVVLVEKPSRSQPGDSAPIGHFKRAAGGAVQGQRGQTRLPPRCRQRRSGRQPLAENRDQIVLLHMPARGFAA